MDGESAYVNHEPSYHQVHDSVYVLPNDTPEHERLETQARHLSAIMNDQIIHAPIEPSSPNLRILDVGCGTGYATDYLGTRFAHAQVFGLDLSPVPQLRERPANVRFLQGNVLSQKPSEWSSIDGEDDANAAAAAAAARAIRTNDREIFDLIYSRLLICGLTDWPKFIQTEFSLLKPGGYSEVHEVDWIWYDKSNAVLSDSWPWFRKLRAFGETKGINYSCGSHVQQWMRETGFEDVQVREYRWPFGGEWGKTPEWREWGEYGYSAMQEMFWHAIPRTMEGSGCSLDEIQRMRQDMWHDFQPEEGKHWKFWVTVGRKPV